MPGRRRRDLRSEPASGRRFTQQKLQQLTTRLARARVGQRRAVCFKVAALPRQAVRSRRRSVRPEIGTPRGPWSFSFFVAEVGDARVPHLALVHELDLTEDYPARDEAV